MELWRSRFGPEPFWQRRFYDFNVFSEAKTVEKIQYMHHNPVKRGLVTRPELWKWSSYRVYAFGEHGPVKMDWLFPPYVMRQGNSRRFQQPIRTVPRLFPRTLRKPRRVRHPHLGIATENQKHDLRQKAVPPASWHYDSSEYFSTGVYCY